VLLISWIHGCIGLYFWLRMKAFYKTAAPYLLAVAVLVRRSRCSASIRAAEPSSTMTASNGGRRISPGQGRHAGRTGYPGQHRNYFLIGYLGLLVLVVLAKGARAMHERRGGMISLSYGNGRTVRVPKGSACWRRACATTCPMPASAAAAPAAPPAASASSATARAAGTLAARSLCARPGWNLGPSIRLAASCGRPPICHSSSCSAHAVSADGHASNPTRIGQERYLVSMFVDMRGSTKLAEKRLPFDNRVHRQPLPRAVSQAVLESGGRPNQFVGDGMLALFGLVSPAGGLPSGAARRGHDRRQCRRTEQISRA